MNKKRLFGYLFVLVSVGNISAQESRLSAQEYKLWYDRPAQVWTEALPLGNGRLGAMVYGTPATEQIQLNEETIWAGRPNNNANPNALEYIPRVRDLVFAGKYLEAQTLATEKVMAKSNSGMPYQSFGDLRIAFPGHTRYTNYYRELSLDSARTLVRYAVDGVQYRRETITSFTDQVIMVRLTANRPGRITFNAQLTSPHQDVVVTSEEGNCVTLSGVSSLHEGLKGKVEFQGRLTARNTGGQMACADGVLSVEGADEAIVYVSIATNFNNYQDITGNPAERAKDYLVKAMTHSFTEARKNHTDFYRRYLTRVSLDLGDNRYEHVTTDKRVENFKQTNDAHLVARGDTGIVAALRDHLRLLHGGHAAVRVKDDDLRARDVAEALHRGLAGVARGRGEDQNFIVHAALLLCRRHQVRQHRERHILEGARGAAEQLEHRVLTDRNGGCQVLGLEFAGVCGMDKLLHLRVCEVGQQRA